MNCFMEDGSISGSEVPLMLIIHKLLFNREVSSFQGVGIEGAGQVQKEL